MKLNKDYVKGGFYEEGYPNLKTKGDVFEFITNTILPKQFRKDAGARKYVMPIIVFLRECGDTGATLGEIREACGIADSQDGEGVIPKPSNQVAYILRKMRCIDLVQSPEFKSYNTRLIFNSQLWSDYILHQKNAAINLQ